MLFEPVSLQQKRKRLCEQGEPILVQKRERPSENSKSILCRREREHSTAVSGFECVILEAERGSEKQNMTLLRECLKAQKTETLTRSHCL